jgi:hypothetical protein
MTQSPPTKRVFKLVEEMHRKGILKDYAIGGAVATIYYTEPFATRDIDVFFVPPAEGKLVLLTPFYEFFLKKGYKTREEYVMIGDSPIQFIPASTELEREAVANAITVKYEETSIKILRAEYLTAIFLKVYRPKDRDKLIRLLGQANMDKAYLSGILRRHKLRSKFDDFVKKFYE